MKPAAFDPEPTSGQAPKVRFYEMIIDAVAPIAWAKEEPPTAEPSAAFRAVVTINRSFAKSRHRRTRLVLEL
jgi:hypothetical protein